MENAWKPGMVSELFALRNLMVSLWHLKLCQHLYSACFLVLVVQFSLSLQHGRYLGWRKVLEQPNPFFSIARFEVCAHLFLCCRHDSIRLDSFEAPPNTIP
jgi:hypothetical protein